MCLGFLVLLFMLYVGGDLMGEGGIRAWDFAKYGNARVYRCLNMHAICGNGLSLVSRGV